MKSFAMLAAAAVFCVSSALGAAADGKAVYDQKCKSCHGADGKGNPAIAKMMKVELKPLGAESAEDIKEAISKGHGKMKPVNGVSAKQADDVAAYIHTLK